MERRPAATQTIHGVTEQRCAHVCPTCSVKRPILHMEDDCKRFGTQGLQLVFGARLSATGSAGAGG